VARLFDKDQVSTLASSVPQPYSSENPHAEVRTIVVSLSFTRSVTDKLFLLLTQNLYPGHQINVELSDGDDYEQSKPSGDDIEDGGAPLVEQIAPNPISSSVLEQVHSLAADQVDPTVPSASGQKRKCTPLSLKRIQPKPPANQVMIQIEHAPYREPQSPLNLVAIEIIFGHLFEAFRHASQAARSGALAGDEILPIMENVRCR
jgi:hypothetical protein